MLKDGEPVKAVPIRNGATHTTSGKGTGTSKPRRQSVSHKDPEVVLVGKFFAFLSDFFAQPTSDQA